MKVVEVQLESLPAEVADLANRRSRDPGRKAAALFLNQELADTDVAALGIGRRRGAREQHDVVGAVGERAPGLGAVDHPFVALARGLARDTGEVGAGVGLGKRKRPEPFAAGDFRKIAALVLFGNPAPQRVAARDDAGDAHPGPRQLLGHQRVFERAEPQAAVLFGNQDAEVAQLGHLVAQRHRDVALLGVELVGDRQDLLDREVARHLLYELALFGDVTHGWAFLLLTRLVRRKSITSSPRLLWPSVCQLTIPLSGRLPTRACPAPCCAR